MKKIFGIDLGTNSIGWAIRELNSSNTQIVHKGVLTFEKGIPIRWLLSHAVCVRGLKPENQTAVCLS